MIHIIKCTVPWILGCMGICYVPIFLSAVPWKKFENHYTRIRLETILESISKSILETIILGPLCMGNAIAITDTIIFLQMPPPFQWVQATEMFELLCSELSSLQVQKALYQSCKAVPTNRPKVTKLYLKDMGQNLQLLCCSILFLRSLCVKKSFVSFLLACACAFLV